MKSPCVKNHMQNEVDVIGELVIPVELFHFFINSNPVNLLRQKKKLMN